MFGAVAAFAFAVRFVYLLQARACPMFDGVVVDGRSYWSWSERLVAGDWLGDRVFYQAPLYPYALAVTKLAVGSDLWNVRLVQIAFGSIACGVMFLAGRRFFSRPVGIAAGLLTALYPSAIFFDGCIQKAGIGLLWMALLLWALALVRERPGSARWLGVGAALGALMLTREETILLAPVLLAWLAWEFRSTPIQTRLGWAGAWAAGLALVLAPVALRNLAVGGEFALTTSQAGSNFYIGNHPGSDGTYQALRPGRHNPEFERQDAFELAEEAEGRALTPGEVSRHWFGRSFAWIGAKPGEWLALLARKAALLVNAYEVADADDVYFYERFVPLLRWLMTVWHYGVLVPFAAAGIALTWARRREIVVLHAVLATMCAGIVLFYVFSRYRYPVVPILLLFAGAGLVEAFRHARERRWSALAVPALLALVAAIASNAWQPWPPERSLPAAWANSGIVQAERGANEAAVALFRRALEGKPDSPEYWGNLGVSLTSLERHGEAADAFRRALELRPADMARAHLRLGMALGRSGKLAESVVEIDAALALAPGDAQALTARSTALVMLGRDAEAVATLRRLIAAAPDEREPRLRLAYLLATSADAGVRDAPAGLELARTALRSADPRDAQARDVLATALAANGLFEEAAGILRELLEVHGARNAAAPAWRERLARHERGQP